MSAARKYPLPPHHPAECYAREPWAGSHVVPFPMIRHRRALAQIAVGIVKGRRRGGIDKAVEAEAMRLFLSQVPKELAEPQIVAFERELTDLVEEARRRIAEAEHA